MAQTITVTNVLPRDYVVVGERRLAPGDNVTFRRKDLIITKFPPTGFETPTLYTDLYALLGVGHISVVYDGIALTAAQLPQLAYIDAEVDDTIHEISFTFDDGGAGNTFDAVVAAPHNLRVVGVQFTALAAVISNDVNYAGLSLENETTTNTIAFVRTRTVPSGGSGDIAQWATYALTVDPLYRDVTLGDALHFPLVKNAGGVAVAGEFKVLYKMLVS